MEDNNSNNGRGAVAVAFLIGAVTGGIAALLFAPQSGARIRGRIRRGARDLKTRGGSLVHEMQDQTGNMKGAASEARIAYREEMDKRRTPTRNAVVEKAEQA